MSDHKLLSNIGARIRKIRGEKKMTQYELAVQCGFEKASMSRLEAGKTNATVLTLHKISKALNVHIADLFKD
jgi:transcriptional regulator with XRE-family HTH domain